MLEKCKKYYDLIKLLFLGAVIFVISSCSGGESIGKNPYCEFVDGDYTFDIDLRRSIFFVGKDFEYEYYSSEMEECKVEDAKYVKLKALGNYFDENIREEEDVDLFYSSLCTLPEQNKVTDCTLNILTTMEAERIIYLVRSGYSYQESKEIVYNEIWEQLKQSGLFEYYDFLNVQAFEDLNIEDDCLKSLTSYFFNVITKAAMVVEDKTICASVLIDFVNNYAVSGDLELSQFNLDVFSKVSNDVFALSGEDMLLKYSVTYYDVPFDGGVPQVYKGSVYYGVDTSSFKNRLSFSENSQMTISWPNHENFTCNGCVNIQGKLAVDSLKTENAIEIIVKDIERNTLYTTFEVSKDTKNPYFAEVLWLEKAGKYEISVNYCGEQIVFKANNLLHFTSK